MEETSVSGELPDFIQASAVQGAPIKAPIAAQVPLASQLPADEPYLTSEVDHSVPKYLVYTKRTAIIAFWVTIWPLTIIPELILAALAMAIPGLWQVLWSLAYVQLGIFVLGPLVGVLCSIVLIVGRQEARAQGLRWPHLESNFGTAIVLGFVTFALALIGFFFFMVLL